MKEYYVVDLVPGYRDKALTIHGAWSHRSGGELGDGWQAIRDAGLETYTRALRHVIFESNDQMAFPEIAARLFRRGD